MLEEINIDWCMKLHQQGSRELLTGVTLQTLIETEGINSLVQSDETKPSATRFKDQNQNFQ